VLPRLVESGYASVRKVPQDQRPDKSVYRLTRSGRAALKEWIEETPMPPDPGRNPLLIKLFFGDVVAPEVLVGHIRQRRQEAEELRDVLEEIETKADPEHLHSALTRGWGLAYTRAFIRWARQAERELAARSET
jgi:DNA-binding PadR family transcriptional regulator